MRRRIKCIFCFNRRYLCIPICTKTRALLDQMKNWHLLEIWQLACTCSILSTGLQPTPICHPEMSCLAPLTCNCWSQTTACVPWRNFANSSSNIPQLMPGRLLSYGALKTAPMKRTHLRIQRQTHIALELYCGRLKLGRCHSKDTMKEQSKTW